MESNGEYIPKHMGDTTSTHREYIPKHDQNSNNLPTESQETSRPSEVNNSLPQKDNIEPDFDAPIYGIDLPPYETAEKPQETSRPPEVFRKHPKKEVIFNDSKLPEINNPLPPEDNSK